MGTAIGGLLVAKREYYLNVELKALSLLGCYNGELVFCALSNHSDSCAILIIIDAEGIYICCRRQHIIQVSKIPVYKIATLSYKTSYS